MKTLIRGKNHKVTYLLAHGAGAPMDSDWMNNLTDKLVSRGIRVVRFEFPYMNERRLTGKKRPPNKKDVLLNSWREVINSYGPKVYIGGKSMGGRMATLIADEMAVLGVICFGFPFHAPGKDVKDRIDHLKAIKTKTLIIQGERDSMGTKQEVESYVLSKKIKVEFLEDGDHSLKPRKKSGFSLEEHLEKASDLAAKFMK